MIGAPLRYLTDRTVQSRHDPLFPWGTFTVNVVGCLILGLLTGAVAAGAAPSPVRLFAGTGLCAALTTYSTFSYETLRLAEDGARFYAAANVTASVVAGLGAAFTGAALARAIRGQPSREAPRGVVASRRCR
ncbi:CrcB family protein [Streptomyces sp. NPDC051992]|uniref:fluoride efflux transporter FluC n=1 Tax=Streptomyces sp. NPDC051992 TaxID=3161012 RepID=UPI0034197B1C